MNVIRKLMASASGLSAALDRLAGLAHQAGDMIEDRLESTTSPPALSLNGDGRGGGESHKLSRKR